MRHDHLTTPFDGEADEASDLTQQFWGSSRGWVSHEHPVVVEGSQVDDSSGGAWHDDSTGSLRAIRGAVRAFRPQRVARPQHTGHVERTRRHGVVGTPHAHVPRSPAAREASLGELAAGSPDDGTSFDPYDPTARDTELVPLSPVLPLAERIGVNAVDPLLVRTGLLALVGLLLIPIALALRPGSDGAIEIGRPSAATEVAFTPETAATDGTAGAIAGQPVEQPLTSATGGSAAAPQTADDAATGVASGVLADTSQAAPAAIASSSADEPSSSTVSPDVGDVIETAASSSGGAAVVSATAERFVPECPATYVAGAGDSWYRIADAAGVTPTELMNENLATVETVIFPGADICLPAGAAMPSQPVTTTEAPVTTQEPASTSTAPATTEAPATTAPATTEAPAAPPASALEAQQIIRDVWPDELEDKALEIAWRESNYIPTAYNGWCCYGLFQIY